MRIKNMLMRASRARFIHIILVGFQSFKGHERSLELIISKLCLVKTEIYKGASKNEAEEEMEVKFIQLQTPAPSPSLPAPHQPLQRRTPYIRPSRRESPKTKHSLYELTLGRFCLYQPKSLDQNNYMSNKRLLTKIRWRNGFYKVKFPNFSKLLIIPLSNKSLFLSFWQNIFSCGLQTFVS